MSNLHFSPWRIAVDGFEKERQAQFESIFCQGNGVMGMRCAAELPCAGRVTGTFVAGCFNRLEGEVSELPNMPDMLGLRVQVDGEEMTMEGCGDYHCALHLDTGLVTRRYTLKAKNGKHLTMEVERLVSLAALPLCAQRITFSCSQPCLLQWTARIDGQQTNSGAQHFVAGQRRCDAGKAWYMTCQTSQTRTRVAIATTALATADGARIAMERRCIGATYTAMLDKPLVFSQFCALCTDLEKGADAPLERAQRLSAEAAESGFDAACQSSADAWRDYWAGADVEIDSDQPFDQAAIRFALYHLRVMTSPGDNRVNIGAKGLSGEAYKGHTFWDTEMFLLSPWLYTSPLVAKTLLEYRFLSLPKAREKAAAGGFRGALFPWESAGVEEGEVAPLEGDPDVVTGKPIPIRTGTNEIHVNADVAMGVWRYFEATADTDFMTRCGNEMLRETALYWATRASWNAQRGCYEINDVIGPDEYSECANNNAYTNILAHWNMRKALALSLFTGEEQQLVERVAQKLCLPVPDANGVLPQADGWLDLRELDITPYKGKPAAILKQYNVDQLRDYQVSKQADVVALLSLLPERYEKRVCEANFDYYEARCLHDSSLSYSTHCLVATRLGRTEQAYALFGKAASVDLNNGTGSAAGIHAAAMGGIWQCVVLGFGGASVENGALKIAPALPGAWRGLRFHMVVGGKRHTVNVTRDNLEITNE